MRAIGNAEIGVSINRIEGDEDSLELKYILAAVNRDAREWERIRQEYHLRATLLRERARTELNRIHNETERGEMSGGEEDMYDYDRRPHTQ